ncbi:hypothetical protein Tsubulata_029407 [Turnera subulata]|uniref:NAD-dependent epimerase/dehydratase domain-containing protein n=1 Tax=Turnera subulata TaxID=218843 RepID=A0A9Q0F6E7_9ROSI|nr:hypothetical protein Tsubulata_029407 [Turnera subulata]
MAAEKERVCVTGAGGYVASWLVKDLLDRGYIVHGTVRDPGDKKNDHLKKLPNSAENLQLFKADLLDYDSLCAAISGCTGVFHVASPVPAPGAVVDLIEPAVIGTRNVLNASFNAKVKRVVVVSSTAAVKCNPSWPKDKAMDEECWSDTEFCKSNQPHYYLEQDYYLAKTIAEREALEYAERTGLDIVTVCPSIVLGPMLQPTLNTSSSMFLMVMKGGLESMENTEDPLVDVRDVAKALVLVYEKPEAKGRYLCTSYTIRRGTTVDNLKKLYPNYNYPKSFTEVDDHLNLTSQKLQNLGWKYRPIEDTLVSTVRNFQESGLL